MERAVLRARKGPRPRTLVGLVAGKEREFFVDTGARNAKTIGCMVDGDAEERQWTLMVSFESNGEFVRSSDPGLVLVDDEGREIESIRIDD